MALSAGFYKYSIKGVVNLRAGDIFIGGSGSFAPIATGSFNISADTGWFIGLDKQRKHNLGETINNALSGVSLGVSVCEIYCITSSTTFPSGKSKNTYQTLGIGAGMGVSFSVDNLYKVSGDK